MAEDAALQAAAAAGQTDGVQQPPLQPLKHPDSTSGPAPRQQQQNGAAADGCGCLQLLRQREQLHGHQPQQPAAASTAGSAQQQQPQRQQQPQQPQQQLHRLGSLEGPEAAGDPGSVPPLPAEQLERLSASANVWALASHLYWGIWAIVQVGAVRVSRCVLLRVRRGAPRSCRSADIPTCAVLSTHRCTRMRTHTHPSHALRAGLLQPH
jgi:hypothetical protein